MLDLVRFKYQWAKYKCTKQIRFDQIEALCAIQLTLPTHKIVQVIRLVLKEVVLEVVPI